MSKLKKQETVDLFEPSREEVVALKQELEKLEQVRIGGRLQPRIDIFAAKKGLIRFDEYGNTLVKSPAQYQDLMKTYQRVQGLQWYEQEQYFEKNPGKREEHFARIREMFKELRAKLNMKLI